MSYLFDTYVYPEPQFVRGEGVFLFDDKGRDYLDFSSGIAVNCLGHAHPHLISALKQQSELLWHTSNLYAVPGREKLAKRLCDNTFADKAFFTNSGAEAMECAIKTARHYHYDKGASERTQIITFEGAFHGRTLATIAAGGKKQYMEGFGPATEGFLQLPYGDKEAIEAAISSKTAGIMLEPIMGEGGIREHSKEFFVHLRKLCDEHDILLIYDEIQSGMGRTGKLFAYQATGIAPDIMGIAKGLGGGFPVGACLATERAAKSMTPGTHGSTFGGNPMAMAVANAVLDVILEEGFLEHVNRIASRFQQNLAEYLAQFPDLFEEVRGQGLLLGLKCRIPNSDVVIALREEKVLVPVAGDNIIRLLPPLNIDEQDLSEAHKRMSKAFAILSNNLAR